jgi:hypothetical protein
MSAAGATDDPVINSEETAGSTRYQSGPLLDAAVTEDSTQDAQGTRGAAPSGGLEGVMLLMKQLIESMPANIAAAVKVDKPNSHLDNAKLDIRNFQRINTFSNKHGDWKEWKSQFAYAVAECDVAFAATIAKMEKQDKPIDPMSDLTVTQNQLSAVLFNRLQSVTTGTANTMVLSAEGNGCESWRLLNRFFDPQTDQRLTRSIMDVINYKIKGKDIQSGTYH